MGESVRTVLGHRRFTLKPGDVVALNNPFNGGTHLPDVVPIVAYVEKRHAIREATIFGNHGMASAFDAAMLNGSFVHAADFAEV